MQIEMKFSSVKLFANGKLTKKQNNYQRIVLSTKLIILLYKIMTAQFIDKACIKGWFGRTAKSNPAITNFQSM